MHMYVIYIYINVNCLFITKLSYLASAFKLLNVFEYLFLKCKICINIFYNHLFVLFKMYRNLVLPNDVDDQ